MMKKRKRFIRPPNAGLYSGTSLKKPFSGSSRPADVLAEFVVRWIANHGIEAGLSVGKSAHSREANPGESVEDFRETPGPNGGKRRSAASCTDHVEILDVSVGEFLACDLLAE